MAKCRIGHFVEAQVLESLEVDYIDESEVLTPADHEYHIDKWQFKIPFVCGCRDLGEALRRISEGAAMIRTKGEAGTGNIVEAVRHIRTLNKGIISLKGKSDGELEKSAKEMRVPLSLVQKVVELGRLPVVNFAAGGVATPADAALCMQLGVDGVFVGSGIFKSSDPERRAQAIVDAVAHFSNPKKIAEASEGLGKPMDSLDVNSLAHEQRLSYRGN
jgi:pyridoxal 5'-phosphate synthase pdxS subunit